MRILLVNDDGFSACGINALAEKLYVKHEITVVAPKCEMSGMSHAAHFFKPLKVEKILNNKWECYSVDGTPVDCVMLGVLEFCKLNPIDLIICGINDVPNIGTDIMFSGTVQQAIEGIYLGVPAIAISGDLRDETSMVNVADWLVNNLERFSELAKITAININFPRLDKEGFSWQEKFTPLGHQDYTDSYLFEKISETEANYTLVGEPIHDNTAKDKDCDVAWYKKGYITISPLCIRLNDADLFEKVDKIR